MDRMNNQPFCTPRKMNIYTYNTERIKEQITMRDAIAMYTSNRAPKHNRIPCPIHNGDSSNLYFTDKLYYCYVCGDGGDVIRFVQHVCGLSFKDALDRINTDFGLALPIHRRPTLREQRDAQKRHDVLMAEREREDAEKRAYDNLYNALWDEYARLDRNRMEHAPKSPDEELHPLYIEALNKIEYQLYKILALT